jgi:hypothetical protein
LVLEAHRHQLPGDHSQCAIQRNRLLAWQCEYLEADANHKQIKGGKLRTVEQRTKKKQQWWQANGTETGPRNSKLRKAGKQNKKKKKNHACDVDHGKR